MKTISNLSFRLPNELWLDTFSYLSWKECLKIQTVCKLWHQLLNEDNSPLKKFVQNHIPNHLRRNEFEWKKWWINQIHYRDNLFHHKYEQHVLKGHLGQVTHMCMINDYLASASKDGTLRVWNPQTQEEIVSISLKESVRINLSANIFLRYHREQLCISDELQVHLWNVSLKKDKPIFTLIKSVDRQSNASLRIRGINLFHGILIIINQNQDLECYKDGKLSFLPTLPQFTPSTLYVCEANRDGKRSKLLCLGSKDGVVGFWDLDTEQIVCSKKVTDRSLVSVTVHEDLVLSSDTLGNLYAFNWQEMGEEISKIEVFDNEHKLHGTKEETKILGKKLSSLNFHSYISKMEIVHETLACISKMGEVCLYDLKEIKDSFKKISVTNLIVRMPVMPIKSFSLPFEIKTIEQHSFFQGLLDLSEGNLFYNINEEHIHQIKFISKKSQFGKAKKVVNKLFKNKH